MKTYKDSSALIVSKDDVDKAEKAISKEMIEYVREDDLTLLSYNIIAQGYLQKHFEELPDVGDEFVNEHYKEFADSYIKPFMEKDSGNVSRVFTARAKKFIKVSTEESNTESPKEDSPVKDE